MAPLSFDISPLAHLPHSTYEEDQAYQKTILTTHVLHRGFQAGAVVGLLLSPLTYFRRNRSVPAAYRTPLTAIAVRSAGTGAIWGTGLLALALVGRMYGKTKIEWQERSWRLIENKFQMEVDEFSLVGTAAAAAALVTKVVKPSGWRPLVGTLGLGNVAGVTVYMLYRHGMKGGKFE